MAEAMAFGKPVIATGYSGNLEFMTPANSYLCSYEYREIGEGANPYPPTSHWAQPNLDEAAEYMRGVYFNRDEAMARGLRAADDIRTLHSPAVAGAAVGDRILSIRARRARFGKILPAEVIESRLEALEAAPRTVLRISEQEKIERAKLAQLAAELQTTMRQLAGQFEDARLAIKQHSEKLDDRKLENQLNQISQINAKVVAAEQTLTSTITQLEQHLKRIMTVESETGRLQGLVPDLRAEAERLERMDSTLATLSKEVGRITRHMDAVPFMTDPRVLQTEDPQGHTTLGYRETTSDGLRSDGYIAFESIFRGSEEMIRERQRGYLEIIEGRTPVLDLGCGRGEMLDLLKEKQIAAVGVDQDASMIARAAAKGHKVERRDIIEYLAEQPEHSIGAIFCAQVIEHLPHEKLMELLKLARGKLKPDGLLILETINPHSHRALKTFWVDPTHNKPIFPEVLVVLCKETGYPEASVRFPCGTGNLETDRLSEGEYAVVAKTAATSAPGRENNSRQKKTNTHLTRRSLHA
jgi:2-polyprenyl-3-methyl-5-hydroxy-6-metoxy-1,4-benzoquinol methylase